MTLITLQTQINAQQ